MQCRQGKGLVLNCECEFSSEIDVDRFPWKKLKQYKNNQHLISTNFLLNNKTSLRRNKCSNSIKSDMKVQPSLRKVSYAAKSTKKYPQNHGQRVVEKTPNIHYHRSAVDNSVSPKFVHPNKRVVNQAIQPKFRGSEQILQVQRHIHPKPIFNTQVRTHPALLTQPKPFNQFMVEKQKQNYQPTPKNNSIIYMLPKQSFATSITDTHSNDQNNLNTASQVRNRDQVDCREPKKKKSLSIGVEENLRRPLSMGKFQQFFGKGKKLQDFASSAEIESVLGEEDEGSQEYSQVLMSYKKIIGERQLEPFQLTNFKLLTENDL